MILTHKNRFIMMLMLFGIVITGLLAPLPSIHAMDENDPTVLVVYSSRTGEIDENQRLLDMLLGHFTMNVRFINSSDVQAEDLHDVTHLFYYGQTKETVPATFQSLLESYKGALVVIGHNVEQLGDRFTFVKPLGEEMYTKMFLVGQKDKETSVFPHTVLHVNTTKNSEILVKATHGPENVYPLFIKNNKNYYFASSDIRPPLSIFLGEVLHGVFNEEHTNVHPGYIRLEDVHPLVKPENLMVIAEELKKRNIPYMVAVIPVYTNPDTGERHHLADSPNLLKALKYMQDNGGSIVLHGYTHQFRASETGEGFEFWDVKNNMPIYHRPDEKIVNKTAKDFNSPAKYEAYKEKQKEFERAYIEKKLTKGIQELTNYGLYPLAFEAPHYTMSQHGYAVVSEFFSTYVGQVQISDNDWEIMTTAPYYTSPTFFHGMKLLPETMGYVQPNDPNAVETMLNNAKQYSIARDGMIAGFYHPYLIEEEGIERFIELIDKLEKIPGIEWIDLKQMENTIQAENVEIKTSGGEIIVNINKVGLYTTSWDYFFYHVKVLAKHFTWWLAGAGALAVVLFSMYTISTKKRYKVYRRRGRVG